MYLTAHHVKARDGSIGVNAYLNQHKTDLTGFDWDRPDVSIVADSQPGKIVLQSIDIKPGGNSVLSYLDVVAPDDTSPSFIADSLRLFEHYIPEGPFPAQWSSRRIALRFGITIGLQKHAVAEYRRLRARALLLLGFTSESRVRQAASRLGGPLVVVVRRDARGETYSLDPASAMRVASVRPDLHVDARIRISSDTRDDFAATVGSLYPHVVASLTGLSEGQLARLGGFRVLEGSRVLWELAGAEGGYSSPDISPRQTLGVWTRENEALPRPDHAPTGAVLPRLGASIDDDELVALDLVQVQDVWLPLSEAAVQTYSHSSGLTHSEPWRFVTKPRHGDEVRVFASSLDPDTLDISEVERLYGKEAAERARADRKTLQLRLRRLR